MADVSFEGSNRIGKDHGIRTSQAWMIFKVLRRNQKRAVVVKICEVYARIRGRPDGAKNVHGAPRRAQVRKTHRRMCRRLIGIGRALDILLMFDKVEMRTSAIWRSWRRGVVFRTSNNFLSEHIGIARRWRVVR